MEPQGGLFGGCWCTWSHFDDTNAPRSGPVTARELKQRLVEEGVAHAALVVRDDRAVAWAEYGTVEELPHIHHRKQYDAETDVPPDWRVTCIQVDTTVRRQGLAEVALRGAVDLLAVAGGGVVEGYPHDMALKEARRHRRRSSTTARDACTSGWASPT